MLINRCDRKYNNHHELKSIYFADTRQQHYKIEMYSFSLKKKIIIMYRRTLFPRLVI